MYDKRRVRKYARSVMVAPLTTVLFLVFFILSFPEEVGYVIDTVREVLGNTFGSYYLVFGLAFVVISLYLSFSKYGNIRLGEGRPEHSNLSWAFMIFTATMAADILFYSLHEWSYYYNSTILLDQEVIGTGEKVLWSQTYSLFHWGATPWIFYILPSVAYAYMMHISKRDRQKISEACRPILGDRVDGLVGKVIDIFSVVILLLATSTTFSVATPLLSSSVSKIFGIGESQYLSIFILILITVIYTSAVLVGFKGISKVSSLCVSLFLILILLFLLGGNLQFIVENTVSSLGNLFQNFIRMSTWTDPLRVSGDPSGFPQNWTVFYWSYWIAWSVAVPFFIAKISKGRTIREVLVGGTLSGVACTFLSFSVLGGHGISEAIKGNIDPSLLSSNPSDMILKIFETLPLPKISLLVLILAMIGFYASTFDALTHVISSYSYLRLSPNEEPSRVSKIYWSVLFTVLPCALLFAESTSYQLQGLSIIAAFPMSLLMVIVVAELFKEMRKRSAS